MKTAHKESKPLTNKWIFLIILLINLISISRAHADNWYTQASIVNLRAEPNSRANIVAKLPIGTFVRSKQNGDEWLNVTVPLEKPLTGWLHRSILDKSKPSLNTLSAKIQQTGANDYTTRLKWLERAAAIVPGHTPVLEDLANTLDTLGQKNKALQVRQEVKRLNSRGGASDLRNCKRGLDGQCETLYYAPDSFLDQEEGFVNTVSFLSCREAFIEIYKAHRKALSDTHGMTLDTLSFTIPADKKPACKEFENNRYLLMTNLPGTAEWWTSDLPPANYKASVSSEDHGCSGVDYIVKVDQHHARWPTYELMARAQSIPTTRETLPYLEVSLQQDKQHRKRIGTIQANSLVTKIWTEATTEDNWIGEVGATGITIRTNDALYITRPGVNKPQHVFDDPGIGKYTYRDAWINSVIITDINDDDLPDIIITAVNTGQNLLVSTGATLDGKVIWETHPLKRPLESGVGGC